VKPDESRESPVGSGASRPAGREAVFEGDDVPVQQMAGFCRRGPAAARVGDVQIASEEDSGRSAASSSSPEERVRRPVWVPSRRELPHLTEGVCPLMPPSTPQR
jgi:hypothetical protein